MGESCYWVSDFTPACATGNANNFHRQQELYLPAYYQTEFKTIYIGEHTSYTHAWVHLQYYRFFDAGGMTYNGDV